MPSNGRSDLRRIVGRLLDRQTNAPLSGFTVRAFDLNAGKSPKDLGYDITSKKGLFTIVSAPPKQTAPPGKGTVPGRRFRLQIRAPKSRERIKTSITVPANHQGVFDVRIPPPPKPRSRTLTNLASTPG